MYKNKGIVLESCEKMLAAPRFSFLSFCNKWKKAQAPKFQCVCRTGLKASFDSEAVTPLPDRLLCQQKQKKGDL